MRKVIEYLIFDDESSDDLSNEITEYLSLGWELYGHPFATSGVEQVVANRQVSWTMFYQAMVKYEGTE